MEIRVVIECGCINNFHFNVYIGEQDDLIYGCILQLLRFMHEHNFKYYNIKDIKLQKNGDQNRTIGDL